MLVTGGAGFIGSHLVARLLSDGHEVVCLDNFDPYYDPGIKRKNIAQFALENRFTLVEGSILNERVLQDCFDGVDYVFHEAAQAGVRTSIEDPLKAHEVNATGTLRLLEAAVDSNAKKVVYASSSSVYGTVKYLPFDEEHPTLPVSPYGVSKLSAEHYCRVFDAVYGLKTVSLRYFTVYGPSMRPDLAISIFTRKALAGEDLEIFGTGKKTRDFTYIDDVIDANISAMRSGRGSYNIGSGKRTSIQSLADKIIEATGGKSKSINSPDAIGDAEHTWADVARARKELGWEAKIELNEGLRRYVQWYRSQTFS